MLDVELGFVESHDEVLDFVADMTQDVLKKTGGDVEKTSGLFGIESAKILKGLASVYSEAEKQQKGSGSAAVEPPRARSSAEAIEMITAGIWVTRPSPTVSTE